MFGRVYFLIMALVLFAPAGEDLFARRICHDAKFSPNFSFQVQAAMIKYEYLALVIIWVVCIVCNTGIIRIWERPYADSLDPVQLSFETWYTTAWLTIVAVTGMVCCPPYPSTYVGRAVTLASNVFGIYMIGLLIAVIEKSLTLEQKKKEALRKMSQDRWAVNAIRRALEYNLIKSHQNSLDEGERPTSKEVEASFKRVEAAVKTFKNEKDKNAVWEDSANAK